jgi:type II secretory pathway pseudopilin PulG
MQPVKANQIKNSRGMTLIELSVVMLLIMMAASLTLPLFTGIAQSTRNQITEARVTQIKQAIVNVQTINGTPTVSGFVADVGRLPYCIQELINQTCNNVPTIANSWKGPYLQTSDGTFYDGWGNSNTLGDGNFGWFYSRYSQTYQSSLPAILTPCTTASPTVTVSAGVQGVCDTLTLQSYGGDGFSDSAVGATAYVAGSYDADYPASLSIPSWPTPPNLISPSDWIVDLSTVGLNVQFNHPVSVISPTILTTCAGGATTTPSATLTGTTVTTSCPTGTTSVTSTITCPTGYTAATPIPPATTPPAPVLVGSTVNLYCQSATGNISIAYVTCSDNLTPPGGAPSAPAIPPALQAITVACAVTDPSKAASTTTPLSQTSASGVPVTLLIPINDLYGNSIIPITPTSQTALSLWFLPSTYTQANTFYYTDYPTVTSISLPAAPMAVGNWNICAFQSAAIPAEIPFV